MGWFNVLKGAYPSLQQIDRPLDVAAGEAGIVRGSCIYIDTNNNYKLATAAVDDTPGAYIFWCLPMGGQEDFQAGMAGTIGQGPAGGVAKINGLACGMPFEFETDQYDTTQVYAIGDLLMPGALGKVTLHTSGKNCIGQVTQTVRTRWANDAIAVTGRRTGANVNVLTARSMWLPVLAV